MTTTATKALRLAARFIEAMAEADVDGDGFEIGDERWTAADLRDEIRRGLDSLRQGPRQIHALELHARLTRAVDAAGSEAALARRWASPGNTCMQSAAGTSRQDRPCWRTSDCGRCRLEGRSTHPSGDSGWHGSLTTEFDFVVMTEAGCRTVLHAPIRAQRGKRVSRAYYNENDPYAAECLVEAIAAGAIPIGDVDRRSIEDVVPSELDEYAQCHFFAGIGGWPLALRQAGWPDDRPVWTASCPCQPFSSAGKGRGFDLTIPSNRRHTISIAGPPPNGLSPLCAIMDVAFADAA